MSNLQDRLAELRLERPELKNAQLAKLAGVKPPSVVEWFNGPTQDLKWKSAEAVAAAYGVNSRWLCTGEGPKYPNAGTGGGLRLSPEVQEAISRLDETNLQRLDDALRSLLLLGTPPRRLLGGAPDKKAA